MFSIVLPNTALFMKLKKCFSNELFALVLFFCVLKSIYFFYTKEIVRILILCVLFLVSILNLNTTVNVGNEGLIYVCCLRWESVLHLTDGYVTFILDVFGNTLTTRFQYVTVAFSAPRGRSLWKSCSSLDFLWDTPDQLLKSILSHCRLYTKLS